MAVGPANTPAKNMAAHLDLDWENIRLAHRYGRDESYPQRAELCREALGRPNYCLEAAQWHQSRR